MKLNKRDIKLKSCKLLNSTRQDRFYLIPKAVPSFPSPSDKNFNFVLIK